MLTPLVAVQSGTESCLSVMESIRAPCVVLLYWFLKIIPTTTVRYCLQFRLSLVYRAAQQLTDLMWIAERGAGAAHISSVGRPCLGNGGCAARLSQMASQCESPVAGAAILAPNLCQGGDGSPTERRCCAVIFSQSRRIPGSCSSGNSRKSSGCVMSAGGAASATTGTRGRRGGCREQ